MKVKILKDCSYSADGFSIVELTRGEVLELPLDIQEKFIARGLVGYNKIEEPELFSPVEETAVIEPVKEVKRRRRKKKAE